MAVTKLDRDGIAQAFVDMLKADTGTLYGVNNYVQLISADPVLFSKARIDDNNPFKLFIWASSDSSGDVRMQNSDEIYLINMLFVGLKMSTLTKIQQLDDAYERVKKLANDQMFGGSYLSSYHSDSNASVVDIEVTSSELPPPEPDENWLTTTVEGAIQIIINRIRD